MAQHGTLPLPDVSSRPVSHGDQEHARSVEAARERRFNRHASRPALQNGGSGAGDRACLQDNAAAPLVRYEDRERASPRRRSSYVPPPQAIADGHHVRRCLDVDMDESAGRLLTGGAGGELLLWCALAERRGRRASTPRARGERARSERDRHGTDGRGRVLAAAAVRLCAQDHCKG